MKLKPAALSATEFYTALVLKVLAGFLYGYLFLHYYNGDDTWKIHRLSLEETQILLSDPLRFFSNEFTPAAAFRLSGSFGQFIKIYANDLEYAATVKTLAFFNLISQGNYYINAGLFNLILFWGHYWCFLFFRNIFPGARKLLVLTIFFFPPVVFWLSGIRADGLLFFFLSLYLLLLQKKKNIFLIIFSYCLVFVLRPPMGALLLAATIPYLANILYKGSALLKFISCYFVAFIIFFAFGGLHLLSNVQEKFLSLEGTRFYLPALQGDIWNFITVFPIAVTNVLFRPFIWETTSFLQLSYSIDVIFFWLVIVYSLIRYPLYWRSNLSDPIVLLLISFSLTACILIGYIVPFPGAIARYRIIPELLLICIALGRRKQTN